MHLFAPIVSHLQILIENGGNWVIFVVSILEGLPAIGSLVPGHTLIILAGFLAKTHILRLSSVLILATGGAIIGDAIGFLIGNRFGYNFLDKIVDRSFIRSEHVERARKIIDQHTGKAIILGRFNPITRALTPFLVGASGVHISRFWFYEIVGAVIWSVSSVLVGYVFGASYHIVAGYVGKFVFLATIIAILILWGYRVINKQWHVFVQYDLFILIANLASLAVLFKTIQDTVTVPSFMAALDVSVNVWIAGHTSTFGIFIMDIVTSIGSPLAFAIILTSLVILIVKRHQWRNVAVIILSFWGVSAWVGFIKDIVMRTRPVDAIIAYSDYSFPSLHSAVAGCICVLVIYLYAARIQKIIIRELVIVGSVLLTALIAFSRVYLSVHWFSDVVAGYFLGIFWTTLMILTVKYVAVLAGRIRDAS